MGGWHDDKIQVVRLQEFHIMANKGNKDSRWIMGG